MKSWRRLIEPVTEPDNIRLAFLKAARGKRARPAVRAFAARLDDECRGIRDDLLSGSYPWGRFHQFPIRDPKPRVIAAAPFRDRVAHHALMNVCEPYFDAYLIHDTYACRKGKGLDAALGRAVAFSRRGGWHLKLDVHKCFPSIAHDVLIGMLERRVGDRVVLGHFRDIVRHHETSRGRGLPIGSLTSQHFANHYLGALDHYVKQQLGCRRYIRYMDDFVLWHDDRAVLRRWLGELRSWAVGNLRLALNSPVLMPVEAGLSYCGFRVFPGGLRLGPRSRRRFRRRYAALMADHAAGRIGDAALVRRVEPMLSFVRRAASRAYRQRVVAACGDGP